MIIEKAASQALATSAVPAKKIVFLGMTAPELVAVGAGVAVGGALCYTGYRIYKRRKNEENDQTKSNNLKSVSELLSISEYIPTLDSNNLQIWFQQNHVDFENAKLMIAIPTVHALAAIGYQYDTPDIKLENYIIQSIYDSKSGVIYKFRFVEYGSIESSIQVKLLENDGLVILNY